VGTPERIPQIQSPHGSRLFNRGIEAKDQMTWSMSIDGESVPLLSDSYYRIEGYKGLAWWIAVSSAELPATVCVEFETNGDQPTVQGDPVVLWTEQGEMVPWGATIESTIELNTSDSPASTFPSRQESLWRQHTVYKPQNSSE